ncbi:hypothetical protein [Microbacterium rhizomatis]|uniref:Exo-alpha-sialidase n=1 Tax=Microbacterium rhizomatis TaxID=1631477 RepID=A0A5J5J416_9MICO|nr:hypothetical protein [Microbacterium rhizomatis]KAA9110199.1 hypothetical protein F6B43_00365 [Microbacterium rhizomatis]
MGWTVHDLHADAHAPLAAGAATAYLLRTEGTRHIVYRASGTPDASAPGTSGHLWELYAGADGVWHPKDITDEADAPLASAPPTSYAFEDEGSQHVLYRTDDGRLHELYQDDGWHHSDLTDAAHIAPRVVGQAHGWASVPLAMQFVTFRMTDGHVHVLSRPSGDGADWSHAMVTAPHDPVCAGDPTGYAFQGAVYITYRDPDGSLYEISHSGSSGWSAPQSLWANLPTLPPAFPVMPRALGDAPSGFGDEAAGTRHVQFLADRGRICEYSFDGSAWSLTDLTDVAFTARFGLQGYPPVGYLFASAPHAPRATEHCIYVGASGDELWVQELWRFSGQDWSTGFSMQVGDLPGAPTAFADSDDGTQHIVFTDVDQRVMELRWTAPRIMRPPGGPIQIRPAPEA